MTIKRQTRKSINLDLLAGSKARPILKGLRPILETWAKYVQRFSDINPVDTSYTYNERALLSTLGGAAWGQDGWISLEEYWTDKRPSAELKARTGKESFRGRCDLYMSSRHGKAEYACEAKHVHQPVRLSPKGSVDKLLEAQKKAFTDAAKLFKEEAAHRVAITFCIPTFSPQVMREIGDDDAAFEQRIQNWVAEALEHEESWDAYAYVFPKRARHHVMEGSSARCPGVLLTMKVRKRGA